MIFSCKKGIFIKFWNFLEYKIENKIIIISLVYDYFICKIKFIYNIIDKEELKVSKWEFLNGFFIEEIKNIMRLVF